MAIILFQKPDLSCFSRNHQSLRPTFVSPRMNLNFPSPQSRTKEGVDVELQTSLTPHHIQTSRPSDIQFDRLQPSDQDYDGTHKTEFGKFIAREVVVDEEYWQAAAWLRAESHWEDLPFDRYTNSFKRKFADQQFNELKRRGSGQHKHMSTCVVAVKKQDKNVKKRTVLQSVVGTLDLSIRYLIEGETFPGERVKAPIFSGINKTSPHRYGYVTNLCVSKSARRQGIATNMLNFSIKSAKAKGVQQVFVQVYTANAAAKELYLKMGFQGHGQQQLGGPIQPNPGIDGHDYVAFKSIFQALEQQHVGAPIKPNLGIAGHDHVAVTSIFQSQEQQQLKAPVQPNPGIEPPLGLTLMAPTSISGQPLSLQPTYGPLWRTLMVDSMASLIIGQQSMVGFGWLNSVQLQDFG